MSTSLSDENVTAKIINVETEIKEVKVKINKVEGKIDKVEDSIKATTSDKEKEELREEKKQLGKRLLQLGDEKNKLLGMLAALTQPPQGEPQSGQKRKAAELESVCFPATTTSEKVIVITEDVALRPFGHFVPQGRIFQRECYERLMQKVFDGFEETRTVMLTGTPGVGKSLFGLLFLRELIRRLKAIQPGYQGWLTDLGGRIVYEHTTGIQPNSPTYFYEIDTRNGTVWAVNDWPHTQQESDIFLIRDGPCGKTAFSGYIFWASSPRPDDFARSPTVKSKFFYMPAWTEEELIDCWENGCSPANLFSRLEEEAQSEGLNKDVVAALEVLLDFSEPLGTTIDSEHFDVRNAEMRRDANFRGLLVQALSNDGYKKAVLRRWATDLGPVARRVFNPFHSGYFTLDGALSMDTDLVELTKLKNLLVNGKLEGDTKKFNFAHALLIMDVAKDFLTYEFVPSSPLVGRRILSTMLREKLNEARDLLGRVQGTHKGLVFEPLAHHLLRSSQTVFRAYSLEDTKQYIDVNLTTSHDECVVSNSELCNSEFHISESKYYVPADSSFPVIDAWTSQYMFQMTVSSLTQCDGHPIKSASKLFLRLQKLYGAQQPKLVFVVPESERSNLQCMKPQQCVHADSKLLGQPKTGWNSLQQYVLFV